MINDKEIEEYYKEHYHNGKKGASFNINKQLKIDLKIRCLELSRKSKKVITGSSVTRLLIVRFLMETNN